MYKNSLLTGTTDTKNSLNVGLRTDYSTVHMTGGSSDRRWLKACRINGLTYLIRWPTLTGTLTWLTISPLASLGGRTAPGDTLRGWHRDEKFFLDDSGQRRLDRWKRCGV